MPDSVSPVISAIIDLIAVVGAFLWKPWTFFALLATGIVCTVATKFVQYRALSHGVSVLRGHYDDDHDPGAISHFQALSAALSGTVGLGNIGGVALAISIGGPGALFWMWVTGVLGMAIKSVEVTLALMYRNTDDPRKPSGGAMWVIDKTLGARGGFATIAARVLGTIFCLTLIVSTITGGNIFQAWNVAEVTESYFGVNQYVTTTIMAVLVALTIIGGVQRIGAVAGALVPAMCGLYMVGALVIIGAHITEIPAMFALVIRSAFSPTEAGGAFLGAGVYHAFSIGLQRALFSNEAGQGSAPIAHSAARTNEPAREGIVAGLEPFIDTIIICTMTAMVILLTGVWNRPPEIHLVTDPVVTVETAQDGANTVALAPSLLTAEQLATLGAGTNVFMHVELPGATSELTGSNQIEVAGSVTSGADAAQIEWGPVAVGPEWAAEAVTPVVANRGVYRTLNGASLTSVAFDTVIPGAGSWLVILACWLFALSTQISWAYYGEQGVVYLFGERGVLPYKVLFVAFAALCPVFANTRDALLAIADLGTGAMLWGNLPILFLVGWLAIKNLNGYNQRLDAGEFKARYH